MKEGKRAGVPVIPGRIKQARLEAGLSQSELAGNLSRSAIQQIETGHVRPTKATLEMIATRTGRPISFFMDQAGGGFLTEPRVRLAKLRAQLVAGDAAVADEMLALKGLSAFQRIHTLYLVATLRLQQGRYEEAEGLYREGLSLSLDSGREATAFTCRLGLAHSLAIRHDPVAPELLGNLLEQAKQDRILSYFQPQVAAHLAWWRLEQHDWRGAAELLEESLNGAFSIGRVIDSAAFCRELGAVEMDHGDHDAASFYFDLAYVLIRTRVRLGHRASHRLWLAKALIQAGQLDRAREAMEDAIVQSAKLETPLDEAELNITQAELALAAGQMVDARAAAEPVTSDPRASPVQQAQALRVLALAEESSDAEAMRLFAAAIGRFEAEHNQRWLSRTHTDYARWLEAKGDLATALEHWKHALNALSPGSMPGWNPFLEPNPDNAD